MHKHDVRLEPQYILCIFLTSNLGMKTRYTVNGLVESAMFPKRTWINHSYQGILIHS